MLEPAQSSGCDETLCKKIINNEPSVVSLTCYRVISSALTAKMAFCLILVFVVIECSVWGLGASKTIQLNCELLSLNGCRTNSKQDL